MLRFKNTLILLLLLLLLLLRNHGFTPLLLLSWCMELPSEVTAMGGWGGGGLSVFCSLKK